MKNAVRIYYSFIFRERRKIFYESLRLPKHLSSGKELRFRILNLISAISSEKLQ